MEDMLTSISVTAQSAPLEDLLARRNNPEED